MERTGSSFQSVTYRWMFKSDRFLRLMNKEADKPFRIQPSTRLQQEKHVCFCVSRYMFNIVLMSPRRLTKHCKRESTQVYVYILVFGYCSYGKSCMGIHFNRSVILLKLVSVIYHMFTLSFTVYSLYLI